MPKIDAPTVSEHRAQKLELLISAAEEILAEDGLAALTAGAVAGRAGLARNSLYRYFDSIDDLIELVVTREFPLWVEAVQCAVAAERSPRARIVAYVEASLRQAAASTHGWRSSLARQSLSESARLRVRDMHRELDDILGDAFAGLADDHSGLQRDVIKALVDACIRRIDAGDDDVDDVVSYAREATRRLLVPTAVR